MADKEIMVVSGFSGQVRCAALLVLVYGNEFFIEQQLTAGVAEAADIAAHHQRYAKQAPKCKVCAVFDIVAAAETDVALAVHTDNQHIWIIKAAGTGHEMCIRDRPCVMIRPQDDPIPEGAYLQEGAYYCIPGPIYFPTLLTALEDYFELR